MSKRPRMNGRFLKSCGSNFHNDVTIGTEGYSLQDLKGPKPRVTQLNKDKLIERHIIDSTTKYICSVCLERSGVVQQFNRKKTEEEKEEEEEVEEIESYEHKIDIICSEIKKDVASLYKNTNGHDIEELTNLRPSNYLKKRPVEIIKLIATLCGIESINENCDEKRCLVIAKIIELIYNMRNSRLVMPVSFIENLITYTTTHSRNLVTYLSKVSPAGAYTFLESWFTTHAVDPIQFPNGLVRSIFDNEQKVGKTWRIKMNKRFPLSVITSHANISLDTNNNIQEKERLMPKFGVRWSYLQMKCMKKLRQKKMKGMAITCLGKCFLKLRHFTFISYTSMLRSM